MLSGTVSRRSRHKNEDEDVGMDMDIDSTQQSSQEEEGDGDEGDDVPETRITLVNENDLDGALKYYLLDMNFDSFFSRESCLRRSAFYSCLQPEPRTSPCTFVHINLTDKIQTSLLT